MDGAPDDNFSLSSVFNQSYFVIPDYQRDYAWSESNVNDLLDDIEFIYEQNIQNTDSNRTRRRVNHYFGTFVFEERGSVAPTDFLDFDVYGVVDGQQRLATVAILMSAIIDAMSGISSGDHDNEDMSDRIDESRDEMKGDYIEFEGREKVRLGGLAEDAYETVVLGERSAEDYLEKERVDAERKIAQAKKIIQDRLSQWKNERFQDGNSTDYAGYYKFLNNIGKMVTQRFEVNIKMVEDIDEAARMFKVINDRGRDLSLHDKVRSHLVYCASQSDDMCSEDIYKQFNNVVENITIHDGFSDTELDDLIRIHWEVFASERSDSRSKRAGPSDIHRRLSDIDDFADVQREDYECFIKPYLNSLEQFSERYPYLTDRDKFADRYYDDSSDGSRMDKIVRKIQLLFMHAANQRVVTPLLISTAEKFGVNSKEFANVVSELEKLVLRYGLVKSRGTQPYANQLSSIANDLYWSDVKDREIEQVFNSHSSRYVGYQSKELGIKNSLNTIVEKREDIAPIDEVIHNYICEQDILQGSFTPGWGGVRKKEVIKYIMYEYERSLRGMSGLLTLSPYHEFRESLQIEHLVARNAEGENRLDNHDRHRDRLGNLAVLSAGENSSEGNNSFAEKYSKIYSESSLNILRNLNGPDFSLAEIETREEAELIPFIRERWGE